MDPDAFAAFYRRHAGRLLDDLARRVDDPRVAAAVCAETFALALERAESFDPARGSAEAAHPRRPLPRPSPRPVLGAVAALALVAAVAAFALGSGDAAPGERAATPPQADPGPSPLLRMLPTADCGGKGVRDEPASPVMPDIGLLQRERRQADALAAELLAGVPVETLDRTEPRLARNSRMKSRVHVVPSLAVSLDGRCDPNSKVELPSDTGGCAPAVSARLMERVAAIAEDGARLWASDPGVEFWVVPVVRSGTPGCAPATHVCVVAVPEGAPAGSYCVLDSANWEGWQLAPLHPGNAVVLGLVSSRATGARVMIGDQSALVEASQNVLAGVLPFPYDDFAESRVDPTYARDPEKPRVGVVDAAGGQGPYHAEYLLRRLAEAGYPTVDRITPGIKAQRPTYLYWRPGEAPDLEIGRIARLLGVDRVIRIDDPPRAPGPVLRTDAAIVIVAGQGVPSPG